MPMTQRRQLFVQAGAAAAAFGGLLAAGPARAAAQASASLDLAQPGASSLQALHKQLERARRRRDFKTVPMILTDRADWDDEALRLLRAYTGGPKQVWDNTDVKSPWLNLMRNALNAQVWSWGHPDFLAVSATHGTAHLALYDEHVWAKYKLAALLGAKAGGNSYLDTPAAAGTAASDFENPAGAFSPADNSVTVLQRRGVVFLACHNAIWEFSGALIAKGNNPDRLSHEQLAAELSNHLIPGAVLTPGVVATIPELQAAGYHYIK
ncbi:MAG: transcriptional initiation protein Tat [Betaproteobacteria bacterium]|nr:transcriptional initiation protein Tat [Betaproteobacteria bacterium]MDE2480423.1 transcriptional initiation protein Tat [Betaproteobacteria bacterium]